MVEEQKLPLQTVPRRELVFSVVRQIHNPEKMWRLQSPYSHKAGAQLHCGWGQGADAAAAVAVTVETGLVAGGWIGEVVS